VREVVVLRLPLAPSRVLADVRGASCWRAAPGCRVVAWPATRAVGESVTVGPLAERPRLAASVRADGVGCSEELPDDGVVGGSAGRPGGVAASLAACHGARDPADAQAGMSAGAVGSGAATRSAWRG